MYCVIKLPSKEALELSRLTQYSRTLICVIVKIAYVFLNVIFLSKQFLFGALMSWIVQGPLLITITSL